jgi:hypothetical protein
MPGLAPTPLDACRHGEGAGNLVDVRAVVEVELAADGVVPEAEGAGERMERLMAGRVGSGRE